ncbi:MAG: hypothetical protein KDE08_04000 [Rhodobacteraceae bacterium]|nr:hypothetical protein [Paracoccaceae bacterium]
MFEAFLATTSSEGLSALGMREQRSYELISDTVRDQLGPDHAALFGEPVATAHGDRYDWYAAMEGRARKLQSLSEEEQAKARETLGKLTGDIRALAEKLGEKGSADDQRLSEALSNALEVPGEDFIFVVEVKEGDGTRLQPVLINWAWVSDEQRAVRGVLTGASKPATPRPPVRAAAPVAATGAAASAPVAAAAVARDWTGPLRWLLLLGWLLLALMLAAIILLMVRPCALNGPSWLSFCTAAPLPDDGEVARGRVLQDMIAQVEQRIAIADRACQPAPPPPPPAVEPTVVPAPEPPASDIENRLDRAGALRGDLTISLAWNSRADLDLSVTCPRGQSIWYRNREICNGRLDVDSNARRNNLRNDPVENIFFNTPAGGRYNIKVTLFDPHGTSVSQPFELLIRTRDDSRVERGVVTGKGGVWSTQYNYAGTR